MNGVWIAFGWDASPYLIGAYPTETEALRAAVDNYGEVLFLPWGMSIMDAYEASRTTRSR